MSTVVDLSALGSLGFAIQGDVEGDLTGASVSNAGDINGDGFDDIIIGAPAAGHYASGAAFVVFGHAGGFGTIDLSDLHAAGFRIQGSGSTDYTGVSVSAAGDINGDGFDDLIVGTSVGGYYYSGISRAYVIFGKDGDFNTINVGNLAASTGFVISGTSNRGNPMIVANAGDINGDGFADLIIGDRKADGDNGAAYVVFGHAGGFGTIDLTALNGSTGFKLAGSVDIRLGVDVSGAGDVNGDGFDDLIVGAYFGDGGGNNSGQAYVIFGSANGFTNTTIDNFGPAGGFVIYGDVAEDWAGRSVSAAGDVNGDGFGDLIVGAPLGDDGGNGAGEAYVIFGHAGAFSSIDLSNLGSAGFIIQGDVAGDAAGWSVSAAGDVNGDGFDDLIVGAPFNDAGGSYAGAAYVIYGRPTNSATIDLTNLPSGSGFVIQGDVADDRAGTSVSAAGDVNGDGIADVVVGARTSSLGGNSSGAAYVIYGTQVGPRDVRSDFNGDGRSDVLWRAANGDVTNWLGQTDGGFAGNTANAYNNASSAWHIVGIGDFNGDNRDDILWQGDNGHVTDWLGQANGGFAGNIANADHTVASNWHAIGVGDFNGDGRDDVLWRSDAGIVTDWLGQGNGSFVGNIANFSHSIDSSWTVAGIGDFDGDGHDDILWRNSSGDIANWLGNGLGGFSGNAISLNNASNAWHVIGVGDFDGDGRDDILWRSDQGVITDWLARSNASFAGNFERVHSSIDSSWQAVGIADYNGDGRDDILWEHDDGTVTNWLGQIGGAFSGNLAFAHSDVGPTWHAQPNPSGIGEWDY